MEKSEQACALPRLLSEAAPTYRHLTAVRAANPNTARKLARNRSACHVASWVGGNRSSGIEPQRLPIIQRRRRGRCPWQRTIPRRDDLVPQWGAE